RRRRWPRTSSARPSGAGRNVRTAGRRPRGRAAGPPPRSAGHARARPRRRRSLRDGAFQGARKTRLRHACSLIRFAEKSGSILIRFAGPVVSARLAPLSGAGCAGVPMSPSIAAKTHAPLKVAVVGSGVAALSAAWLLSQRHRVALYEKSERLGGHSNTVMAGTAQGEVAVDTGFICFNDATYPNLIALFDHLGVTSRATDMSFAVSLDRGRFEYAAPGLFAQRRNLLRPRFWSMLGEILRFYRQAPDDLAGLTDPDLTLGDYLKRQGFSEAFRDDHLLPMAAAIWSSPAHTLMDYPAEAFIRFCGNHGLLKLVGRPLWRTVEGGSRVYVERLAQAISDVRLNRGVTAVRRTGEGVVVHDSQGGAERFDH